MSLAFYFLPSTAPETVTTTSEWLGRPPRSMDLVVWGESVVEAAGPAAPSGRVFAVVSRVGVGAFLAATAGVFNHGPRSPAGTRTTLLQIKTQRNLIHNGAQLG